MSWWVMLLKAPPAYANVNELGRDYVLEPLGTRAQVLAALAEVFPGFDATSAAGEGFLRVGDEEVHLPDEDPISTLSIRPSDLEAIWRLSDRLGARLMDTGSGDFLGRDEGDAAPGS